MDELSENHSFNPTSQLDADLQDSQIRHQGASRSEGRMLAEALGLHRRGFVLIPLKPRSEDPLVIQDSKPTVEEIKGWFAQEPELNIGIVTGALSGIVVVNVDEDRGGFKSIKRRYLNGSVVGTERGVHHYFRHPGFEVPNLVDLLPGVDLRGDGGYVVAAGSINPSGNACRRIFEVDKSPLRPIPNWLRDLLIEKRNTPTANSSLNEAVTSAAYSCASLSEKAVSSGALSEGSRDHQLSVVACRPGQLIGAGELNEEEAKTRLIADVSPVKSDSNKREPNPRNREF